jgi:hypothetical protein
MAALKDGLDYGQQMYLILRVHKKVNFIEEAFF